MDTHYGSCSQHTNIKSSIIWIHIIVFVHSNKISILWILIIFICTAWKHQKHTLCILIVYVHNMGTGKASYYGSCMRFYDLGLALFTNFCKNHYYRKTSNISCTLVGNIIVDHSDVVGASPIGAAPTTSSFSTWHLASRDSAKTVARQ